MLLMRAAQTQAFSRLRMTSKRTCAWYDAVLHLAWAGAAQPLFGIFSGNSKHIQSLIALVATLHGCLEPQQGGEPRMPQILTVNEFLFSKGLDNLNLFRLIRYVLCQH